ncbi:BTB/POZ domain [Popillia japonica]|uniref:BTB/POZ domain n=1 Tax=Popillia japonica TaxID=7064 RepID=A0AAW1JJX7_POPJA
MGGDTSPEQQYALRWNDFQSSILSSFRHLRDEEDFVDVTLACDGCSFTAHKVVLSACSPYFRRLLKANPCQHPIVILRDVQQKDMENLLRFMYNGEVHIGQEQLADFLKTAQMLQVRGLADVETNQKLPVPEQKVSPNSSSLPWPTDRSDALQESDLTSPPPKRAKSTEDTGTYTPERGRSPSRGNNGDTQESLLGQALEGGPTLHTNAKGNNSESSLQAQSTGDDSSSDTQMSDHERDPVTPKTEPSDYPLMDEHHPFSANGGLMDQGRTPFPGALLNLPGLPGLLPGPSSMHGGADNFGDASKGASTVGGGSASSSGFGRISIIIATPTESQPHQQQHQLQQQQQKQQQPQHQQKQQLEEHQVVEVKYECPLCDQPPEQCSKSHEIEAQQTMGHHEANKMVHLESRRSLEMMRVRATDPRPCPKCGKIYRSAHTLRTHLEDKHTICPGYRCVLCGTVAKSRNSLHSHMSRQHRGISTKDLPVLPMPAPFDPDLASRLLAKAGVKISPAELRARASPTGPRRSDVKLDAKSAFSGAASETGSSICDDNDPEDLTMSHNRYGLDFAMSPPLNHSNSAHMKLNKMNSSGHALAAKTLDSAHNLSKEPYPAPLAPPVSSNSTGSAILDTYLQFITENSFGMTQEQAAAAMHAAKLAQLNAMGLDKQHFLEKMQQQIGAASDLIMKRTDEIRRNEAELIHDDRDRDKEEGESSGGEEEEYSDEEAEPEGVKVGE